MKRILGFVHRSMNNVGIYGVDVAENQLLDAIIEYSNWDEVIIWMENPNELLFSNNRVIVRKLSQATVDILEKKVNLIHHVGISSYPLNYLRYGMSIPIFTSVYPALSYNSQIEEHFFQNQAQSINSDTNIFPSKCSLKVVENIRKELNLKPPPTVSDKVIPIGIDNRVFDVFSLNAKLKNKIKLKIGIDTISFLILTRFSPSDKADILPLLRSIKFNSKVDKKKMHFYLCGGDIYFGAKDYIKYLRSEINELEIDDLLTIIVSNNREQIIEIFKSCDVFISPSDSIQETFGLTPLEAMSSGLPVIVSDWNGYKETIINDHNGFLINTTFFNNSDYWNKYHGYSNHNNQHLIVGQSVIVDTDLIVEKCILLSSNPFLLKKMAENAIKEAKKYSWKRIINSYNKLWEKELRNKKQTKVPTTELRNTHDFWRTFNHYSKFHFSDENIYTITPYGKMIIEGKLTFKLYNEIIELVDPMLIERVLILFFKSSYSIYKLHLIHKMKLNEVRFIVSILNKHNLIRTLKKSNN